MRGHEPQMPYGDLKYHVVREAQNQRLKACHNTILRGEKIEAIFVIRKNEFGKTARI